MTNISVYRQLFAVISLLVIHLLVVFEQCRINSYSVQALENQVSLLLPLCLHARGWQDLTSSIQFVCECTLIFLTLLAMCIAFCCFGEELGYFVPLLC
ncbi:hypothetical protein T12_15795 [Trichinella patagoniensis]|uniref:Uncharacterized protein n=1 Tax=Trichinella patagoniensis TaxID=990121 RepID=A0A0V0ZII1_9BILA|nr:hypothetical protein T12_15795 [Trichinella patagoniensis]